MPSVSVTRPSPTQLGLDELRHVVEMISPEYPCLISETEPRSFGLEPILSKDDRTTLCSLSLSCRALREGSQRALMRHIFIHEIFTDELFDLLAARYRDKFPVRKLTVTGHGGRQDAKKLIQLLERCSELEFLSLEHISTQGDFSGTMTPAPKIHFNHLITFRYLQPSTGNAEASVFGRIIATMPRLKNLNSSLDAPTALKDFQTIPLSQLEILSLMGNWSSGASQWMLSTGSSFEALHTLKLSRTKDTQEIMHALTAFLEIVGSRLRVLHICSHLFQAASVISLIHACPNLEDLATGIFEPEQGGAPGPGVFGDQENTTMHILNALCAPLLRLHLIWYHGYAPPPPRGFILPSLCEALQRDHEKLTEIELVSLEAIGDGRPYFNLDPEHEQGIVVVCKARGLRLRYSTETNSVEWGPE